MGAPAQAVRVGAAGRRGRSHRPERRAGEIEYLKERGVRLVVSLMTTRHNLAAYEAAGLAWRHAPGAGLDDLLVLLRRELRGRGAVALHGDRRTELPVAVCVAHLRDVRGMDPSAALAAAAAAGLDVDVAEVERTLSAG